MSLSHSSPLSLYFFVPLRQTTIHNTQRERGKVWLKECDLIGKNMRSASPNKTSSSILDLSQDRPFVPRFITERDVRTASNSHSRTLVSMATRSDSGESVKVSPVHWGDIGGLDRYMMMMMTTFYLSSILYLFLMQDRSSTIQMMLE